MHWPSYTRTNFYRKSKSVTYSNSRKSSLLSPQSSLLCNVLDLRHATAVPLLYDCNSFEFIHWDPMTGEKKHFSDPVHVKSRCYSSGAMCHVS